MGAANANQIRPRDAQRWPPPEPSRARSMPLHTRTAGLRTMGARRALFPFQDLIPEPDPFLVSGDSRVVHPGTVVTRSQLRADSLPRTLGLSSPTEKALAILHAPLSTLHQTEILSHKKGLRQD